MNLSEIPSKKYFVYLTTNFINKKVYAGVHYGYENDNYLGSGYHLNHAIKKYGKENFKREILYFCETAIETFEIEKLLITQEWINCKQTYNIKFGGTGNLTEHIISTKEKISKKKKGIKHTSEQIKANSLAQLKRYKNHPEHKILLSKKRKKFLEENPEAKEQLKLQLKNMQNNSKIQEKRRKNIKKYLNQPEIREKTSNFFKNLKRKPHSEETKRKLSEINKGEKHPRWGKQISEETKQKISKANKERWFKRKAKLLAQQNDLIQEISIIDL